MREGEAPAEPRCFEMRRLGGSLVLPDPQNTDCAE